MSSQYFVFGIAAAITIGVQSIGFTLAYALRTEIFYDILGGINYLVLALFSAISGSDKSNDTSTLPWTKDWRKIVATCLFICSRGWLLIFLAWRAHERGGDARFDEVLGKKGGRMKPLTFFVYWMAQAFWVYLISMPLLFINSSSVKQSDFAAYDIAFATLFGCGVLVEIVADIQKALWVRSGRPGHFCSVGVWSFSRHPNYFGEIFQWWCLWAFAQSSSESNRSYADPLWWACIVSPLFTMHILLNMKPTGLCNAEGENLQRYYDKCPEHYSAYRNSTSILIPMIGYRHVPMLLKRTIFFDFEKYEYKPKEDNSSKKE
ncbi:hypothetical protein HJC23_003848 [Cyclotella cryptica]|uniref:Steroid 5-alpha reductase C-terminal domain-containing protein n=1 Tax=Cyclotella cryptica TaxID=29204 RepID=A0ABD3PZL2_9STRA